MELRKVWIIARQEYLVNIRRAGFIIMTLALPALGALALLLGALFAGQMEQVGEFFAQQLDTGAQMIGVVDRSGFFSPLLPQYAEQFIAYEHEEAARTALLDGELSSVLVIGEDYLETGKVVVLTTGSGFNAAVVEDSATVRAFFVDHILTGQVDPAIQARAADPANVESQTLSSSGEAQGEESGWGLVSSFLIPYFLAIFLVTTIFVSSGYLLQSVAEEKESRVIEIVVSSVRPVELMTGKVAGLGAIGLTQVLIWILSGWGFSGGATAIWAVSAAAAIPARVLVLGVVYYLLGYTLYAILMASVGALGTTMRESQQLAGIFSMVAVVPYMIGSFLFTNPNALVARLLSFFPLTAPTMMMMRVPLAEVPWIDVVGSIAALVLSIPAALWVGSKLFEVGLLVYDKRPTMKEIWAILRGR
ncbi:MAG: ABC transporter permease [Anaerolineae bacterium]|nr:ABC transporter permease [Anaerolineae bacterium]